jgi:hypothetical protein
MRFLRVTVLVALFIPALWSQRQPASAHVNLYFPHFADGGPNFQRWQTTFTFLNMNDTPASIDLSLYNDGGGPLTLDLGAGPASRHSLTIPPYGSRILRSRIASSTVTVGWAIAYSDVPVVGNVAFRALANGVPYTEVTAMPTLPSLDYVSAAKRTLGVALANVYRNASVTVEVRALDAEGIALASTNVVVPAMGHRSFVVHELFPTIANFEGTLILSGVNRPTDVFVAWTLYENDGVISSLPPGPAAWPIAHWDQIWLVYRRVVAAAKKADARFPCLHLFCRL